MISKEGDATLVCNKRGIGMGLPALRKTYGRILNNRLLKKHKAVGALSPTQSGFIRGCDGALFTLSETLAARRRAGRTIYCLRLDFRKALDSVCHPLLWKRMWDVGVRGHMFHVIREL